MANILALGSISRKAVIPAKAGIHPRFYIRAKWIPAFAGMTNLRDDQL